MKGGVNLGYQSEAELEERLMTKLESQGYERIKIEDYEALVENFRKQLNIFNAETLDHELTDIEFKRVMNIVDEAMADIKKQKELAAELSSKLWAMPLNIKRVPYMNEWQSVQKIYCKSKFLFHAKLNRSKLQNY